MTLKEGIYDIREAINALSIDSDFTDRYIVALMNQARAVIIRQHITNNPGEYRNQLTQTLYMELELVDVSRFPEYGDIGITMLATKKAVPDIIGQQMYKEIEVRTVERLGTEIEISHKERLHEVRFAPKGIIYGYRDDDGKLYFISNDSVHKNLIKVTVTAILKDPEAILAIHDLTTDLEIYPITLHLWVIVKEQVINKLLQKAQIPKDKLLNNNDEQTAITKIQAAQE